MCPLLIQYQQQQQQIAERVHIFLFGSSSLSVHAHSLFHSCTVRRRLYVSFSIRKLYIIHTNTITHTSTRTLIDEFVLYVKCTIAIE